MAQPVSDLKRTTPRGWFSIFWAHGGVMAVVAGVLCVVMTFVSFTTYQTAKQFAVSGIDIAAQAVDREIRPDSDGPDDFYVTYRYVVDEQVYQRARRVSRAQYDAAPPGTEVMVRYLPHRPDRFETYIGEARDDAFGAQLFAGFSGIGALLGLWFFGNKANRAVLTGRYGHLTSATVVRVVERKRRKGRRSSQGHLEWRTPDGLTGKSMRRSLAELSDYAPGSEISVYVRKGYSMWEADIGPRQMVQSNVPRVDQD